MAIWNSKGRVLEHGSLGLGAQPITWLHAINFMQRENCSFKKLALSFVKQKKKVKNNQLSLKQMQALKKFLR